MSTEYTLRGHVCYQTIFHISNINQHSLSPFKKGDMAYLQSSTNISKLVFVSSYYEKIVKWVVDLNKQGFNFKCCCSKQFRNFLVKIVKFISLLIMLSKDKGTSNEKCICNVNIHLFIWNCLLFALTQDLGYLGFFVYFHKFQALNCLLFTSVYFHEKHEIEVDDEVEVLLLNWNIESKLLY